MTLVCILMGGLGNQMFQFAASQAVSLETGHDVCYVTREGEPAHNLPIWTVFAVSPGRYDINLLSSPLKSLTQRMYLREFLARTKLARVARLPLATDLGGEFVADLSNRVRHGGILYGYWQSWKYFDKHSSYIRHLFKFRNCIDPKLGKGAAGKLIGMHVRRADYLAKNSIHFVQPESYYLNALEQLTYKDGVDQLLICSDDFAWCKEVFGRKFRTAVIMNSDHQDAVARDLMALSRCDALIMSNSSFSWWAAWLSDQSKTNIVVPSRWYKRRTYSVSNLIPSHWSIL